jgi:hypothetical protein
MVKKHDIESLTCVDGNYRMEDRNSVVRVGDGCGFVVEGQSGKRFVVTAARCLRRLPLYEENPDHRDWIYRDLIGPFDAAVTVACMFIDLVADLAVLGSPENWELDEVVEAFEALVASAPAIPIASNPEIHAFRPKEGARLPSFDGSWSACEIIATDRGVLIERPVNIDTRMYGSPIVNDDGAAIGLVSHEYGGPYPFLAPHLPRWLVDEIGASNPPVRG